MKKAILVATGLLGVLASQAATAAAVGQSGYVKRITDGLPQKVKIHNELPPICDTDTIRAANTVNALGTRFTLTGTGDHYEYNTKFTAYEDPEFLNIAPKSLSAVMTTDIWWTDTGSSPVPYNDATTWVNTDRVYYAGSSTRAGDFACGTPTSSNIGSRIDFESAMVHEFGHFMGMAHRTDGNTGPCVMAANIQQGQIRRSFCSDERGLMLGFYGPR